MLSFKTIQSWLVLCLLALSLSAQTPKKEGDPVMPKDTVLKKTASGLMYSVLKKGSGEVHPGWGDKVKVHYSGWLDSDGTLFDSSVKRGKPAEFALGMVIEGWNEGLALMTVGSRYKFHIPSDLAYGKKGNRSIPPNSKLIFEVELLGVTPGPGVPTYPTFDAKETVTAENGLKSQVITVGDGDASGVDDTTEIHYTFWNTKGVIVGSSLLTDRPMPLSGSRKTQMEFLNILAKKGGRKGDVSIYEVPPALLFKDRAYNANCPENTTTIWRVEIVGMILKPRFRPLDPEMTKTTQSGLKYQIIKLGAGVNPKASDSVTVHYSGWLTDGTSFDSSVERGQPATFGLNQVIGGWTEGVQLMQPGAVYRFEIPSALGYGDRGSPPKIPGGATLVFEIELIKIGG